MASPAEYQRRVIDDELDELADGLAAIAIEGPKGVGKTRTALERARTVHRLDDPAEFVIARGDPARLLRGETPVLIDEWQRLPQVWDLVRRAVDDGASAGSFLLTGSAFPNPPPTHSGAGRIVSVPMRPMAMSERIGTPSVSLRRLLTGDRPYIDGATDVALEVYTHEIIASGFPAVRSLHPRGQRIQIDGYLRRIVDAEIPGEAGISIRNPVALRRWMSAYAAAVSTVSSLEKIRDAASAGNDTKPSKQTTQTYRDALARVWVLDEVPAWIPSRNRLNQLRQASKHQLADPALAAGLLGVDAAALLAGESVVGDRVHDGVVLGALFESLVTLSVRIYARHSEAQVKHLRTAAGRHEIDLIVERADGRVVAIEVKLSRDVDDDDGKHLRWLRNEVGDQLLDQVIINTGPFAYRRQDGIAVVPLALLGP